MTNKLSPAQVRYLRGLGHHLRPVVMIGQHGLRDTVMQEIEQALAAHELVKIKIVAERAARDRIAATILEQTRAESIQQIGQMRVIFRRNPRQPKIALPSH